MDDGKRSARPGFSLSGSPSDIRGALPLVTEAAQRVRDITQRSGDVSPHEVELVATSVCLEHGEEDRIPQVKAAILGMLDALIGGAALIPNQKHVNSPGSVHSRSEMHDSMVGIAGLDPRGDTQLRSAALGRDDEPVPAPEVGPCALLRWRDLFGDRWIIEREMETIRIRRWRHDDDASGPYVDVTLIADATPSIIDHKH